MLTKLHRTVLTNSNYLWGWSGPAVCQRPALWSPWCLWWHLRWWLGSRCTVSLSCRRPPAPQTGRTQPDIKETLTQLLQKVLCGSYSLQNIWNKWEGNWKRLVVVWSVLYLCDSLSGCRESGDQADCCSSICLTFQLAIWHLDHSVGHLGRNTWHWIFHHHWSGTFKTMQHTDTEVPQKLKEVGHGNWDQEVMRLTHCLRYQKLESYVLHLHQITHIQWQHRPCFC